MTCDEIAPCIISTMMLFIIICLVVPICCYATYWLYKYRNHQHIQPRYPSFIIILSILSIFTLLTKDTTLYIQTFTNPHKPSTINLIFEPLSLYIAFGMLIRVWLINYDINYTVWQAQHKWQSLLQNEIKLHHNWYALNKQKYGNWKYMFSLTSILFIILSLTIIAIGISTNSYFFVQLSTSIILHLITAFNFTIILCKIPAFNDQFFIRKEITLIIYINILCIVVYSISAIPTYAVYAHLFISNNICLTMYNISIPFTSTFWVIYKFKINDIIIDEIPFNSKHSPYGHSPQYSLKPSSSSFHLKIHRTTPSIGNNKTHNYISPHRLFRVILNNDLALSGFMEHLQAEFSIENVLSFIELVQWLYNITQRDWLEYDIKALHINFAECVPLSSINKDQTLSWFDKIRKLNDKYIAEHCEYEINIPFGLRSAMRNLIYLMNKQQERMDDIMNKKEKRTRTTTQTQTLTNTATDGTLATVGSAATTLGSSTARKSTATITSDVAALNRQNTPKLTVPRQPSVPITPQSNKSAHVPITPYLGPSVADTDEHDKGFAMVEEEEVEEEDEMVIFENYDDYISPKKQKEAVILPRDVPKLIDVESHSNDSGKGKKDTALMHRPASTNMTPTVSNKNVKSKKLKLEKAESTPNPFRSGRNNKNKNRKNIFSHKLRNNASRLVDELVDVQFPDQSPQIQAETHSAQPIGIDELQLPNAHAQIMCISHSFHEDVREHKPNRLPFRHAVSDNPKSSDVGGYKKNKNNKFSTPKISHIAARMSARLSSFGLFISNKASVEPNLETNLAENIDEETKENLKNNPAPKPKEVGLKDFVHIVNEIILVVQSLNHQSISRWKKTEQFLDLKEKIDLNLLASHVSSPTIVNSATMTNTPSSK